MNNILKISLKRAFLFSLYELGMVLFFNVFSFFEKSNSILFISFVTFVSVFIFHFLILSFIEKSKLELSFRNFLNLTSYLFSSLLSSLMCWFLFNDEKGYVLIILSGFVVPSFLPSVVFFLMSLFKENDSKINAKPITQAVSVAPSEVVVQEEVFFTLENDGGKVLLKVPVKQVICFEANDNYVVTYFLDKEGKLKKSMERISLKKIDEILDSIHIDYFSRVHKSYLINHLMIEEIKGKAQAQKIKLKNLEILIPVSRSFDLSIFKSDY